MKSFRFHDFEAFAGSIKGVDCQMMLQNPSEHSWSVDQVLLKDTHIQFGRLGSGNIVQGQSKADQFLLYLPLSDDCEYFGNGRSAESNGFIILEPGSEFCISTKIAHDWCTIELPAHLFDDRDPVASKQHPVHQSVCRVTEQNPQLARQFKNSIRQIMSASAQCPDFGNEPAAQSATETLTRIGSAIIGLPITGAPTTGRPRISRQEIIDRAMSTLDTNRAEPVLVGQMAAMAGVSERTLETAFAEYFGATPVRYLQLLQLHQVSRALKDADPKSTTVTSILVQHGIWQFGRFAARYRKLFGELPSQTLRQR